MSELSTSKIASEIVAAVGKMRIKLVSRDEATVRHRPSRDRWSIAEVVGHLIDSACNNHQRFVRAQFGESLVFPKYEQNEWVTAGGYQAADWGSLVELWYHYNLLLAAIIAGIKDEKLSTPCSIAPSETCTLQFLLTDYVDHLNHHLRKIDERLDDPDA